MSKKDVKVLAEDLDSLLFLSFRYALGRRTYVSREVADYLIRYKDHLSKQNKALIIKEIEYALNNGTAGDPCDEDGWAEIRDILQRRES